LEIIETPDKNTSMQKWWRIRSEVVYWFAKILTNLIFSLVSNGERNARYLGCWLAGGAMVD